MITVTKRDSYALYDHCELHLAAHLISAVEECKSGSVIWMSNGEVYKIDEDAEYVCNMIKFEMEKYQK